MAISSMSSRKGGTDLSYLAPYQQYMPGLLDYVLTFPPCDPSTPRDSLLNYTIRSFNYPNKLVDVTLTGRFIENHDQPRFAGLVNDTGLRQSALVFNILSDAIPVVFSSSI
jgi:alpha-amylase